MRQVIIRIIHQGHAEKRATMTYIELLPTDFWDTVAEPFLTGKIQFGRAEKTLTVNVVRN